MTLLITSIHVLVGVIVASAIMVTLRSTHSIPPHMLHHSVHYQEGLIPVAAAKELLSLVKTMKTYPTNVADVKFYPTLREHVGEAVPPVNDRCDMHPFLVHSADKTKCVLPGRIDVGKHFVMSGGVDGLKEDLDVMVSRTLSFGRYMFNLDDYPVVKTLFDDATFQKLAKDTCPPHKQHIDPFQFNFIIQIPGQTVPMHIDGAYFWGATRHQFPQWLLACMVTSGLFSDRFVDQVQVVGYLHEWEPSSKTAGGDVGEFVVWNGVSNEPVKVSPVPRSGSAVDGSKVVHAAKVYQLNVDLPFIDKSNSTILEYQGASPSDPNSVNDDEVGAGGAGDDEVWTLTSNGHHVRNYTTDDLRISVVYRAMCFESQEQIISFRQNTSDRRTLGGAPEQMLELEDILTVLSTELVTRKRFKSVEEALTVPRIKLVEVLLDEFIKYPLPPVSATWLPVNYCALKALGGPLAKVASLVC
eukprot:m.140115 g.140115  ORF g.140115 m.140115 type:complete len:470 (-) comp30103_c0_seq1:346-1755(-)